ncbi:type IV toxin-antitoxin system AbiEi family antitoxin domain-containing protein [Mycolicibacterium novocastrense]|uniref:type IV toxin-antitoxin system AbiEi family antitoxin domain-containing protein n=1 Tax=Mycolicibacterium novocastrense TaxID=59813 RepID=UPI0009E7096B|nr:type IV toxin-antitoxin system AbiEi family antitoxin domain-containing protein [Mycolicibacterium novocastrense]
MTRWHLGQVADFTVAQDGVVARRQMVSAGATDFDIARLVRRRELIPLERGVYVNHSGRLTQMQRHWAAVLAFWPAALAHVSALPNPPPTVVHIAIDSSRNLRTLPGIVLHRTPDFAHRADLFRNPPAIRLEHALIDVVGGELREEDVAAAFAEMARVCATWRTTPQRILQTLETRRRVPGRRTVEAMLTDLRDGACSVLERGYLLRVERAHGLPRGKRQARSTATGRATYQDVRYGRQGVVVELDGRAFHDSPRDRDRDALRDLAELSRSDLVTIRLTYGLVFGDTCRTAQLIGGVLRRRGWTGRVRTCPVCGPAVALTG